MNRLRAFGPAVRGLGWMVTHEPNTRIHIAATIAAIALGFWLHVSRDDWFWLGTAVAVVWIAEAFNTAVEQLANEITLEHRERIGRAKDVAAAGVLTAAIGAMAIGIAVFVPTFRQAIGG